MCWLNLNARRQTQTAARGQRLLEGCQVSEISFPIHKQNFLSMFCSNFIKNALPPPWGVTGVRRALLFHFSIVLVSKCKLGEGRVIRGLHLLEWNMEWLTFPLRDKKSQRNVHSSFIPSFLLTCPTHTHVAVPRGRWAWAWWNTALSQIISAQNSGHSAVSHSLIPSFW